MKALLGQAIRFFGYSGIGWLLDFSVFTILCILTDTVVLNNYISSWVGVTFVFIFSTRKLFINNSKISLRWKYAIYIIYQLVLIYVISHLLGAVNAFILQMNLMNIVLAFSEVISKIVVTPITMILNFIVMKTIIEKI